MKEGISIGDTICMGARMKLMFARRTMLDEIIIKIM